MSDVTDHQIERAKRRLNLAQGVLRGIVSGLSQAAIAEQLGVSRTVISWWARALGVAPTRRGDIGAGKSYLHLEL